MDSNEVQAPQKVVVNRNYRTQTVGHVEQVEIAIFATTPAVAKVQVSQTVQLGSYEPFKIEVEVSLPCYKEELDDAMRTAAAYAKKVLLAQLGGMDTYREQVNAALHR